jgi:hypothetical protein
VTLRETAGRWSIARSDDPRFRTGSWTAAAGALVLLTVNLLAWGWLQPRGLVGLSVFATVVVAFAAIFQLVRPRPVVVPSPPPAAQPISSGAHPRR